MPRLNDGKHWRQLAATGLGLQTAQMKVAAGRRVQRRRPFAGNRRKRDVGIVADDKFRTLLSSARGLHRQRRAMATRWRWPPEN